MSVNQIEPFTLAHMLPALCKREVLDEIGDEQEDISKIILGRNAQKVHIVSILSPNSTGRKDHKI